MPPILHHSSPRPFALDRHYKYRSLYLCSRKPEGLWLSEEWQWRSFCHNAGFRRSCFRYNYRVDIDWRKILCLNTDHDVEDFIAKYECKEQPFREITIFIDWTQLQQDYDGLYYNHDIGNIDVFASWDVSSVCVWNLEAIADVTPIDDEN